jgi:hypothetical protein
MLLAIELGQRWGIARVIFRRHACGKIYLWIAAVLALLSSQGSVRSWYVLGYGYCTKYIATSPAQADA